MKLWIRRNILNKKKYEFFNNLCRKKTFRSSLKKTKLETRNEILIRKHKMIIVRNEISNSLKKIREKHVAQENLHIESHI